MTSLSKERLLPPLWVLTVVAALAAVYLLLALKEIVVLLVIGFCIAYVIEPCLAWLEEHRIPRERGIVLLIISLIFLGAVLILTAIPTIFREYSELVDNFPRYIATVKAKVLPLIKKYDHIIPVDDLVASPLDSLSTVGADLFKKVASGVGAALLKGYSLTLTIVNLTLLPFIVYYLAIDFKSINKKFMKLFPMRQQGKVHEILEEINTYVSAFVRGQITVCSILFLLYTIGLATIGVELWLLLGVVAGFGNMVPYLGFLAGISLSSVMALVTFGSFTQLLIVWALFAVVQFLEGTFITPKIIGEKVGLSPLVVILALVAGGTLVGLLGIFLAIPAAAVIKVLARRFHIWLLIRA